MTKNRPDIIHTDFLIVGSGLAGLSCALKLAAHGEVVLLSKEDCTLTNTSMAQGGIAAVISTEDDFEQHIQDTLEAGAGLCHPDVVREYVEQAPQRIHDLEDWGVVFDESAAGENETKCVSLAKEGGHTRRRILHIQDHTGASIQNALIEKIRKNPNICIYENFYAIDLVLNKKIAPFLMVPKACLGVFAFDRNTETVKTILSRATILATGGIGRAYQYTSNWSGATGDGIAMAHRAGARVANLEFMQFHPTCLYHPKARNFLISEAVRGEGAVLVNSKGEDFTKKYHPKGSLAPRDIVARSIDSEMKRSGSQCVYLDATQKSVEFWQNRFPKIFAKCESLDIHPTEQPIPVVPAAHYLCGGVVTDTKGRADLFRLFVIGESACTGFHGANRLASNSLLECLAQAHCCSEHIQQNLDSYPHSDLVPKPWTYEGTQQDPDEMVVVSHIWDEIRRLMWNYVGIVRSNKRLQRATSRLDLLTNEIREHYWNFRVHTDILELRNIASIAQLTVRCALKRKESRGIHFNLNFSSPQNVAPRDTVLE